ncbi:uncharacterized protein LOC129916209 [Episyrphus balteatus]|uniref:uncharacterized protein LOC129916209 n=1 Tax=Episyrphus balteatus TaxID=286459 RepID=UPI002484D964|nr:uncharacterized protein LOC129916209 [Episyrphus balteatus]
MSKFECQCLCDNEECARFHNPPKPPCNCIRQLSKSTKFIERILDCSETIVRVLSICGIHECKAKAAGDVIIFGFLHYQIVADPVCDVLRKKLRKEDLFYDLGRKCRMNRTEAHLAYSIIKKAFKAFYYKQTADNYNPDFVDQDQWMRAAEKTAEVYACSEGLREVERKKLENRIKTAYCSFIKRIEEGLKKDKKFNCTCCFCKECKTLDGKSFKLYANVLPKEDEKVYRFKQRLIEEGQKVTLEEPDPCGHKVLEWQDKMKAQTVKIESLAHEDTPCCGDNNQEKHVEQCQVAEGESCL